MSIHITPAALVAAIAAMTVAAAPAWSADPAPVRLVTEAQQEIVTTDEHGDARREWVDVERIVPGDTVVYIITAENAGDTEVTGMVIDDPIPEHTRYVSGSAVAPNTVISFSVDGGQAYGAAEALTVIGEDGIPRPATSSDFTHIRFALDYPVGPGETARVHFKAAVE